MADDLNANPLRMTRKQMIMFLDIDSGTFDNWMSDLTCPRIEKAGEKNLYHLGDVVRWRIDKEKQDKKQKRAVQSASIDDKKKDDASPIFAIEDKIKVQELRKKTRENDEADGLLVDKKKMEDLFYNLGRAVRENIMSKPQVYGPMLDMKTGFEVTTYLIKEFEKLCNSIAGLEVLKIRDLHDQAIELNDMFIKGYNYAKMG